MQNRKAIALSLLVAFLSLPFCFWLDGKMNQRIYRQAATARKAKKGYILGGHSYITVNGTIVHDIMRCEVCGTTKCSHE